MKTFFLTVALGGAVLFQMIALGHAQTLTPKDLLDPQVSYEADRLVESQGKIFKGRVRHRPGQTLEEMTVDGKTHIVFLDRRLGRAYILPGGSPLMVDLRVDQAEALLSSLPQNISGMMAESQERLLGMDVMRYHIDHEQGVGQAWVTKKSVLLKLIGWKKPTQSPKSSSINPDFTMRLENYRERSFSEADFQLPKGRLHVKINAGQLKGFDLGKILEAFSP